MSIQLAERLHVCAKSSQLPPPARDYLVTRSQQSGRNHRPAHTVVSNIQYASVSQNPLHVDVYLSVLTVTTLIESGLAGNVISGALCRQRNLPKENIRVHYQVQSVLGCLLSTRNMKFQTGPVKIHLSILEQATTEIIVGRPWLIQHQPDVWWRTGEILKW